MSPVGPLPLTRYLLARGLLSAETVVDGDYTVTDASRRNHNTAVSGEGWAGLFVKQSVVRLGAPPRTGGDPPTLAHEAAVYRLVHELPGTTSHLLPECHGYDEVKEFLVLELVPGTEDLTRYHTRTGRFPVGLAGRLGHALADLHVTAAEAAARDRAEFPGRMPWALGLDVPGTSFWRESSHSGMQIISIIQSFPEIRACLSALRAGWRSDAFIHHDLKWENCMVPRTGGAARPARVKVVDWEFADFGDACWDVGSMLGNYLRFWLAAIPLSGTEPPDRYLELARYPLSRMQPAMRRFWGAYRAGRGWGPDAAAAALERSVRYAGVRLLQSTYEGNQRTARLDGTSVCQLQLAANIMLRPHAAARGLFGIAETRAA